MKKWSKGTLHRICGIQISTAKMPCKHTKTLINTQHPPTLKASTSTKAARGTSAPTSPPEFHDSLSPCSVNHWHCGIDMLFLHCWFRTNSLNEFTCRVYTIHIMPNIHSTKNHQTWSWITNILGDSLTLKQNNIFKICGYIPVINSTQNHSHPTTNSTETWTREAFSLSWARSRCAASNLLVSSWSFCVHSSHFQRLMGSWVKWCLASALNTKCQELA